MLNKAFKKIVSILWTLDIRTSV